MATAILDDVSAPQERQEIIENLTENTTSLSFSVVPGVGLATSGARACPLLVLTKFRSRIYMYG